MHCVLGYGISGKQFVAHEKLLTVKKGRKMEACFKKNPTLVTRFGKETP